MGTRFSITLGPTTVQSGDSGGNGQGWRKDLENGDVAVVLHNRKNSTVTLGFDFKDAGFAPDTHVHIRDMLKQADLGWRSASYVAKAVPAHGVAALRLSYVPKYPSEL